MGRDSSTSLAPGFRFHPTDEELVRYYLKRKVCGKPLGVDPITVVDIYKCEPWELPEKSKLKTRDLEWYFFSALDKKYGNGSRTNRATEQGYWKTTGKDRPIRQNSRTVGMKKTLVYHSGRAPKGARSNWVMHEYRLEDEELVKAGVSQDSYVLCRIFQKSGTGPKNGEQYGAPFIEEEWEDNVMAMVPAGDELPGEEVPYGEGLVDDVAFTDGNAFDQGFGAAIQSEAAIPSEFYNLANGEIYVDQYGNFTEPEQPLPINFYHGEASNYVEPSGEFSEADLKPVIGGEASDLGNGQTLFESPLNVMDPQPVKEEYFVQSSNEVGDQFLDAFESAPFGEGLYLETNDLSKPIDEDPAQFDLLDEYLTFFEAEDGNIQFTETPNVENFASGEAEQVVEAHGINNAASSSKQNAELTNFDSDFSPLVKHANQMLGNIPASPAIALEFPSKEALLRLSSTSQASSSSVHVTAGMITIRDLNQYGKNGNVDLVLSYYGLPEADTEGKMGNVVAKGWFVFMFIWVLVMSLSFKVGSFIYTKSCFDS